jgi:hypothetical protein
MATEIFIEPELENLQDENNAAEWFEICSELGLDNQIALADKSETKQAPPYAFCDPKTLKIIQILCPRVVKYKEYKASTIPTDVLKEIQKAEKHGWYMKIEIAYDDQSPDPFVIGVLPNEYEWRADRHLIARWGNELLPFEQLESKAVARVRDQVVEKLTMEKNAIEFALSNPDAHIRKGLAENNRSSLPF